MRIWRLYNSRLSKSPLLTKATTSAAIMMCSDLICQSFERRAPLLLSREGGRSANLQQCQEGALQATEGKDGYPTLVHLSSQPPPPAESEEADQRVLELHDWWRTLQIGITGLVFNGPISHAWYQLLERVVWARHAVVALAIKLVLDAAFFSPVAVAGYFTVRAVLEGEGVDGVVARLRLKWLAGVQASWSFWPLANIINFALVPLQLRVLYNNVLSLGWTGFLSHLNAHQLEEVVALPINLVGGAAGVRSIASSRRELSH